jgi:hypothetical protein
MARLGLANARLQRQSQLNKPGHRVDVGYDLSGVAVSGAAQFEARSTFVNRIIWLVGAVVIVLFILGYFGLR